MNRNITLSAAMATAIICGVASTSSVALELDSENSRVSLVSTKVLADGKASVLEVFSFSSLSGSVADDGAASVVIDLETVDTGIGIRDQRMGEFFFKVAKYPAATITTQIPESVLEEGSQVMELPVSVNMHGNDVEYMVPVIVTSSTENIMAVAVEPVLVDATAFKLEGGLGKLGELAGLLHIPTTVPVSFSLSFNR